MAPNRTSIGESPPTTEIGYSGIQPIAPSTPGWGYFQGTATLEDEVPDLMWPKSVEVWHRMRADSQADALMKSIKLPVRRRRWAIDQNGASDEATEQIASDFGLPIKGTDEPPPRGRRRFNHDDHLRHALLALDYGHLFCEQVGVIDGALNWRLRKLAPRMPQSIREIKVAPDGGLEAIVQWGRGQSGTRRGPFMFSQPEPIPVKWLAAYVWDREGANWIGRSLFRPIYRNYLLKDRILRIDAMRHEKYGLGIPVGKAPKGANEKVITEYGEVMRGVRANPDAGYGIADGATVGVEGVKGSLPDTILSIKYHDEAMARDFLAMVLQLGHTESGSRALGETFSDIFELSVDAISGWYATTTNEFVIEDIIDWNYGIDEGCPLMSWETKKEDPIAASDLGELIDQGFIVVDDNLRAWARDKWDLPKPNEPIEGIGNPTPTPEPVPPVVPIVPLPTAASRLRERVRIIASTRAAASGQTHGATSPRRREPTPIEAASGVDFDAIQQEWDDATSSLVDDWADIQEEQINVLVEAVTAAVLAGSPDGLVSLAAPVLGADIIGDHMVALAEEAISTARAEAASQGVTIELVDVTEIEPALRTRAYAVAALLARSISQTAANQALMRYGVTDLSAEEVAAGVRSHLEELSGAYLVDTLGGALTQAQNLGRTTVFSQRPGVAYASELLDSNTCSACEAIDGTEFATLADAEKMYPTGGYAECEGGPRCRGTVVFVFEEAQPTVASA